MKNREFIEYIRVIGILDENICEDYIKVLDDSNIYIGDYVLKLKKYRDSVKDIVTLCYWFALQFKGDMDILLRELVRTLDDCAFHFGDRTTHAYFNKFEKILLTNLYKHDTKRVLKEMKVILNPISVRYNGSNWGVSKTQLLYYTISNARRLLYDMTIYDMYSDDKIEDIGFFICKDKHIEIEHLRKTQYGYIDPFDTLKGRLNDGLKYDIIGIAAKSIDRQDETVRENFSTLFD